MLYHKRVQHLTVAERQYFQKYFPEVHLGNLGGIVGIGAQSIVRAYDMQGASAQMVIKYPRCKTRQDAFSLYVSPYFTQHPNEVAEHTRLCLHYFGERVVSTELVASIKGKRFYILQQRLSMKPLTLDLFNKHPELRDELSAILHQNRKLTTDTGLWFDFMGWDARRILRDEAYMLNLGVVKTEHDGAKLRMFDLSLYRMPTWHPSTWVHGVLRAVQARNIRRFGLSF
jgi:hypothetical protein